jgi:hypothetical protein
VKATICGKIHVPRGVVAINSPAFARMLQSLYLLILSLSINTEKCCML